jgi:hypothetical protein
MQGEGVFAGHIAGLFALGYRKAGSLNLSGFVAA